MSHRKLRLVIVFALFIAQFLSALAPVNATPLPAPQLQAPQTITLEGKVLAYAIYDPTTINLAGADIAISASGNPPDHVQSRADGSWTYPYITVRPAITFTIQFTPPAGYELPPGMSDTIQENSVPAGSTRNAGDFRFRRVPYQFSGQVQMPDGTGLFEIPIKISYGLPGTLRTAASSVIVTSTVNGSWTYVYNPTQPTVDLTIRFCATSRLRTATKSAARRRYSQIQQRAGWHHAQSRQLFVSA
jgi:hypothetical protein